MDILHQFPNEIVYHIFNSMGWEELGKTALTSMTMMENVLHFLRSKPGLDKIRCTWKNCNLGAVTCEKNASELGKFFKRIYIFLTYKEKIKNVIKILTKAQCQWKKPNFNPKVNFEILFYILKQILRDANEGDWKAAHYVLYNASGIEAMVAKILPARPGSMIKEEIMVRNYYRVIYYDHLSCQEKAIGLNLILKDLAYFYQAKMLLLMFLPTHEDGSIIWTAFQNNDIEGFILPNLILERYLSSLKELGRALSFLSECYFLSLESIILTVFEITDYPKEWMKHYSCRLILECDGCLFVHFLRHFFRFTSFPEFAFILIIYTNSPVCQDFDIHYIAYLTKEALSNALPGSPCVCDFLNFFHFFLNLYFENFDPPERIITLVQALDRVFRRRRSPRLSVLLRSAHE